jgi:hypothetical protein
MDNDSFNGIEVGIAYVAEAKFANTPNGRMLANRFYENLAKKWPSLKDKIYTIGFEYRPDPVA